MLNVQTRALELQQDFELERKKVLTVCKVANISDNG